MTHDLFVYDDDDAFVERMPPFLAEGLDAGEAVIAVLTAGNRELVADALGSASDQVTLIACENHYTRPESALADYDASVRELLRSGAPAIRLCGELPPCETDLQWRQWVAYDAILNQAFAHHPVRIMCVYDERRLPESVVDGALRAHPHLVTDHTTEANPGFEDPAELVREMLASPPPPLPQLSPLPVNGDTQAFRDHLSREMAAAGVPQPRAGAMLIAADEVLSNAHRHGGGARSLRAGRVGERFVCEIADMGRGHDDPLVGYLPPKPQDAGGGGLWVARQLTERLELAPSPGGGLTVTLSV
jgi:anti-sigma regulatory factor (Ser/Thr protein kinase)